jgi:hypothetical protein
MSETNPHLASFVPLEPDSDDNSGDNNDTEHHARVTRIEEDN